MEKIIKVKNLSVYYQNNIALRNISFEINKGDFIGLAGPNGGGKSTLIKTILNLIKIKDGSIVLFNEKLEDFNSWHKIGYLPQINTTINTLLPATVFEIISLGLLSEKKFPKKIKKADKEKVINILKTLSIERLENKRINMLSGGEQQKVLLARSLVLNPEILIFDEPSTALDPNSREDFFNLINKLNKEKGITIILITHDTGYIGTYANKIMYIDEELKYYGEISEFCSNKNDINCFRKIGEHIIWHQHK